MIDTVQIYSLEGCAYSRKAVCLLKEHEIHHKIIKVTQGNKQKYKVENNMDTFPQIFIIKKNFEKKNGKALKKIKIGGAEDLLDLINISHIMKYNEISFYKLKQFYDLF